MAESKFKIGDLVVPTHMDAFVELDQQHLATYKAFGVMPVSVRFPECFTSATIEIKQPLTFGGLVVGKMGDSEQGFVLLDENYLQLKTPEEVEPEPPEEIPPMPTEPFAYTYYVMKKGRNRPGAVISQKAINQYSADGSNEFNHAVLSEDGLFGDGTESAVKDIQRFLNETDDGLLGRGTWGKMTPGLGSWRPSLRLRIAELECSYENGGSKGWGAWNIVQAEGWPNYGIWNVNYPAKYGGDISGSSLGIILKMAGRTDLYQYEPDQPEVIADFFGSSPGREVQLMDYMDSFILGPGISHLKECGVEAFNDLKASNLPDTLESFSERLLALASDICVNSGSNGFFRSRFPRVWDGSGEVAWDNDHLPDRDTCLNIFAEEYGITPPNPTEQTAISADSQEPYKKALRRCLWDVCTDDEQRINIIAEMQARTSPPKDLGGGENLQEMVLRRRRSVARKDGYGFQGTTFIMWKHFGIGI